MSIPVQVDALFWSEEITIPANAHIRIFGEGGRRTIDAQASLSNQRRHFYVSSQATLELVNLTVTAAHHVPVGAACCSTLKQAGEVEIGETIYTIKNGVAAPSTVTKIAKAVKTGLHSPVLTNGHFPVIDDTVTAFDSATKMHLAAYALPILEPACKATGTCASLKKLVGKITGRKY